MRLKAGIYRHYKGELYEVLYTAQDSDTEEWVVVYKALYGKYGLWVRGYKAFTQKVEVSGNLVERFSFVD